MQVFLENEQLKVTINSLGGELSSIIKKQTGIEYMWNGDEKYWKRTSPVLFPYPGAATYTDFCHTYRLLIFNLTGNPTVWHYLVLHSACIWIKLVQKNSLYA